MEKCNIQKVMLLLVLFILSSCSGKKEILYVGTYSQRGSEGLYVYEYDRKNKDFMLLQTLPEITSPNFLAVHPSGNYLLSVNRVTDSDGGNFDVITSYSIDRSTGRLDVINQSRTHGRGACHVSLDQKGRWAFVSHYGSGSMAVFPVSDDGSVGDTIQILHFEGSSITRRQQQSHVHSILVSPDNRFVYLADLGTDKIMIFSLDHESGRLSSAPQPWLNLDPGSGPRHFTFHPVNTNIYVADELSSTVSVLERNLEDGSLKIVQVISTLPDGFDQLNTVADIHTDSGGEYLFVSNRGHNSLAIYRVREDGMLDFITHEPVRGEHPRNFLVDTKGEFVMVANQHTDHINLFDLDQSTGKLDYSGITLEVPAACCLKWLKL